MNSAHPSPLSPEPHPPHNKKAKHSRDDSDADPDVPKQKRKKSILDSSIQDRKKKKRDKGKAKDTVQEPAPLPDSQMPPDELDANAQASAAALLSAIMAAAATSPDMLNTGQVEPPYPSTPPQTEQAQQLMAISPSYSLTLPSPDPSSFLNLGIPLSDIPFGSNEDVLRTLQELDISKIADVLKTLGDAAAAANIPPLPPCAPEPALYPVAATSLQPLPMNGLSPLSNPTHTIPSQRHSGVSHSNTAPVAQEQYVNPEHAELLCTRWLNAAKLAELAQNEGCSVKSSLRPSCMTF